MVAVVHLVREAREAHRQEAPGLDTALRQALEEAAGHVPAAHVVVDEAHLDALAGLVDEGVGHEASHAVVVDDVALEVDVVAGRADGFEQGEGEGGAVGVEVDVVAAEGEGHVEPLEEVDHRGVVRGDAGGAAVDGGGQLAAAVVSGRVAVDDAVFADVLAEEIEENEPQDGQGDQHEGPGYRLDGLAVFEHNDHHRAQHDAEVDGRYGPEDDCQPHVQEQALRLSDKYTQTRPNTDKNRKNKANSWKLTVMCVSIPCPSSGHNILFLKG